MCGFHRVANRADRRRLHARDTPQETRHGTVGERWFDRFAVHGTRALERLEQRAALLRSAAEASDAHRGGPAEPEGIRGRVRRAVGVGAQLDKLEADGQERRTGPDRHRVAEPRARRACDRRAGGGQTRVVREASGRHAGRCAGDAEGGEEGGPEGREDVRVVQLPPLPGGGVRAPTRQAGQARADLSRAGLRTCRTGAGRKRRCSGGSWARRPARARTAI